VYGLDRGTYILCADHGVGATFTGITEPTRERVLPTCYPSAASFDESAPVKLEGSDVEGVEIRMRRGRTFRVTGMVLDSSGLPAESASVGINKHERLGSTGTGVKLMPGARFVLENLAPGSYSISARLGGPDRPEHRAPLEVGFAPVVVAASDIEDLVVPMSRTVDVAGSFALEDPSSVFPPTGAPLYVAARLVTDSTQRLDSSVTSIADDRLAFRLAGLFGRRVLDISNLPRGWYVKSVRYAGKDIVDVPTEFKPGGDPAALEVVLSNRGAVITGRVVDDRGEPVSAAQMIMVPADRSRWGRFDAIAGRSSATGQFRIGPRRPGDYIVLALKSGAELLDSQDVDQLAKLVGIGERVTLGGWENRPWTSR
jgi:hypothetical protein